MNLSKIIVLAAAVCLTASAVMLGGCASTPADRAVNMSKNVAKAGKELDSTRLAVIDALTTLNQLITQPRDDMRSQYKGYLDAVKHLGKVVGSVDLSIDTVLADSQFYFADWDNQIKSINDKTLRDLSQERKQQAMTSLDSVKSSMEQARKAYRPLANDLEDVGKYLGNNLTPSGIEAMKSRLDKIKLEAIGVRDGIAGTVSALNKFSSTLAAPAR